MRTTRENVINALDTTIRECREYKKIHRRDAAADAELSRLMAEAEQVRDEVPDPMLPDFAERMRKLVETFESSASTITGPAADDVRFIGGNLSHFLVGRISPAGHRGEWHFDERASE